MSQQAILSDLMRAKVLFQQRTIAAILHGPAPTIPQLRGSDAREDRCVSPERAVVIPPVGASAGDVAVVASGLFQQRAGDREPDRLGGVAEGVPVHALEVTHVAG